MGRKIHPNAFRLGISKEHQSKWYAPFSNYANFLKEDDKIRKEIYKFCYSEEISSIEILRSATGKEISINIFCSNLSILGDSKKNSKEILVKKLGLILSTKSIINLNLIEIEKPETDANLIAEIIC